MLDILSGDYTTLAERMRIAGQVKANMTLENATQLLEEAKATSQEATS